MNSDKLAINKKFLKELAQEHGKRMSEDCYQAANDYLLRGLTMASKRSTGNNRRTIHSRDW